MPLPPFLTRSRPWSKNWPKKPKKVLKGAESSSSGAVFGIVTRLVPGTVMAVPASHWLTIAGLSIVWSTMRLLIKRGCES